MSSGEVMGTEFAAQKVRKGISGVSPLLEQWLPLHNLSQKLTREIAFGSIIDQEKRARRRQEECAEEEHEKKS
eukprot:2334043-Rhodomonas_salina.1